MRQVKRAPRKKPAAKRGNAKRRAAPRGRSKAKARVPFFLRLNDGAKAAWRFSAPYAHVIAGAFVLLVLSILWAGGYFAVLGDRARVASAHVAVGAGFAIDSVMVRGRENAEAHEILNALGPVEGTSLLHLDIQSARARIEELGWVDTAAVSRLWPDALHITIVERQPHAVWQLDGALRLVDQDGEVITDIEADEYTDLPLFVGEGAALHMQSLWENLAAVPAVETRMTAAIRVSDRRWTLRLKTGADVKLPEEGVKDAIAMLATMQKEHGLLDRPLEYIDLRNRNNVVLRPVNADYDVSGPSGRET